MPRTKSLQHYPDRYQEIIRECGLEGKRIEVEALSVKQALSLRGHWYAFVGSLRAHCAGIRRELEKGRVATSGEADLLELERLAPTVMVQIQEGRTLTAPPTITFQSREHSWQAKLLSGAKVSGGDAAVPPRDASLDAVAARLMAQQPSVAGLHGERRVGICPICGEAFDNAEVATHEPCRTIAQSQGGV